MKNKVSIIVPIFGVEKYIERCARSLFEQSFTDIEYIFVNDCTTDASMRILETVIKDYPDSNIQVINKKVNEGLPQARKTGVQASTGEYIMHIDSDDWVEHNTVEKLYEMAKEKNADMVCCDWIEEYGDRSVVCHQQPMSTSDYYRSILRFKSSAFVWNRLTRRDVYDGVVFPKLYMLEDYVITSQLVSNAKQICFFSEPLNHYSRVYSGQSISSEKRRYNMIQKVSNIFFVWNRLNQSLQRDSYRAEIDNMVYYMLSICLWDGIISDVDDKILNTLTKELRHIKMSKRYNNTLTQQLLIKICFYTSLYKLIS